MRKEIFNRSYYRGFGDSVSETYYEEDGKLFCSTHVSGYWKGETTVKETTKEEIEKVIRAEQDTHIQALAKLNEKLIIVRKL